MDEGAKRAEENRVEYVWTIEEDGRTSITLPSQVQRAFRKPREDLYEVREKAHLGGRSRGERLLAGGKIKYRQMGRVEYGIEHD